MPFSERRLAFCFVEEMMSEERREGGFLSFCVLGFVYNPKCYAKKIQKVS